MAETEARAMAEEQLKAEKASVPVAPPKPTVEQLLTEIRDLLAENAANSAKEEKPSVNDKPDGQNKD